MARSGGNERSVVARVVAIAVASLVALAAGWFYLWTYADPWVRVPPPQELELAGGEGGAPGRVLFLGDFAPTDYAMDAIAEHGWSHPFAGTRELLQDYDAVLANLEAPVTTSDSPWPWPKTWVYKVDPAALPAMRAAGVDGVVLANNHTYDYGRQGLSDTLHHLDEQGIAHLGAGMSEARARRGLVIDTGQGRIGVLAYLQNQTHWRLWYQAFALDTPLASWPGVARLRYTDLAEDIRRVRRHADLVAVTVHWGRNYEPVGQDQVVLGRACIDLGADIVIGHHSHQMQPVGLYRGRPILYSLGNYAFGTRGRSTMRYGMGAALHLEAGGLAGVELVPLLTQNRIVDYRPRVPVGRRLDRFFDELIRGSAAHGAEIERQGNRGWLELRAAAN